MKPEDKEFIDFLFDKLTKHVDTDMIDLQDDDSCCDHLNFEQLCLFPWMKISKHYQNTSKRV